MLLRTCSESVGAARAVELRSGQTIEPRSLPPDSGETPHLVANARPSVRYQHALQVILGDDSVVICVL